MAHKNGFMPIYEHLHRGGLKWLKTAASENNVSKIACGIGQYYTIPLILFQQQFADTKVSLLSKFYTRKLGLANTLTILL